MVQLFQSPPQARVMPQIPQDRPVYRILTEKGFYGPDDTLHPEGSIIVLNDEPNEDMEPLNALASRRLDAYLTKLEEQEKLVAKKHGRAFVGRSRTKEEMLANASEDARRVQTVGNKDGVPLMGSKRQNTDRVSRVGVEEEAVPAEAAKSIEVLGVVPRG